MINGLELIGENRDKLGPKFETMHESPLKNPAFLDIVPRDLEYMINHVDLAIEEEFLKPLLVQSVLGHAQNGHSLFYNEGDPIMFKHATISDIIKASKLDIHSVKEKRQGLINHIYSLTNFAINDPLKDLLWEGQYPVGAKFLKNYEIETEYFLKGMVLGGKMDSFEDRMKTVNKYKTTINHEKLIIGGGKTYLVDKNMMLAHAHTPESLAEKEFDKKAIQKLIQDKIIYTESPEIENLESIFVRLKNGPGTSDDLAFIAIGNMFLKYGIKAATSAMIGAFLIDAIDTYDKCVLYPKYGGLDEVLAEQIQDKWKEKTGKPLVTDDQISNVIFYSAKSNTPKIDVSSSHRRFVQYIGENEYRPTIEAHIEYLKGQNPGKFRLGFTGIKSQKFYNIANARMEHMNKHWNTDI